jgi:hypothetical protein
MSDDKLTIKLTNEQQKQIKDATGRSVTEVEIGPKVADLTLKELEAVAGGAACFTSKVR